MEILPKSCKTPLRTTVWSVRAIAMLAAVAMCVNMYLRGGFWYAALRTMGILACLSLTYLSPRQMAQERDGRPDIKHRICSLSPTDMMAFVLAPFLALGLHSASSPSMVAHLTLFAVCVTGLYYHYFASKESRGEQ